MVSIPRPSLGKLGGSPVTSPRDSSPVSPKSWEDSLLELDSGLQRICGSPSPATTHSSMSFVRYGVSPHLSFSSPEVATEALPEEPAIDDHRESPPPQHSTCRRALSHEYSLRPQFRVERSPKPEFARSQSYAGARTTSGAARPLIVRHEQSSEKLAEKLSRICGAGQTPEVAAPAPASTLPQSKEVMALATPLPRRESLKSGFKHDVNIRGLSIRDIAVSVSGNKLWVKRVTLQENIPLDEVTLPEGTRVRHLMCYVAEDCLYIRERSKPIWSCDSSELGSHYIPVIQEEYTEHLKVVIHIPEQLRYEDLTVRTVDDHLIISRKRLSYPGARVHPFEITLILKDMCGNRGVEATLSHSNQLCIIVSFNSRKQTF